MVQNVRKADLVNYLHGKYYNLKLDGANKLVNDLISMYRQMMVDHVDVIIRYCGKLCVRKISARVIANPTNGLPHNIPEAYMVKFGIPSRPRGCGLPLSKQVDQLVKMGNIDYIAKDLVSYLHIQIDKCRDGLVTVELQEFGKFTKRTLAEGRKCVNPQNHKPMIAKGKNMVRFTLAPSLRLLLNS